jgi:hypothetical protein
MPGTCPWRRAGPYTSASSRSPTGRPRSSCPSRALCSASPGLAHRVALLSPPVIGCIIEMGGGSRNFVVLRPVICTHFIRRHGVRRRIGTIERMAAAVNECVVVPSIPVYRGGVTDVWESWGLRPPGKAIRPVVASDLKRRCRSIRHRKHETQEGKN